MTVDSATIIAIVSLVTASVTAVLSVLSTGWLSFHTDRTHETRELERTLAKYRDPLALAAADLQHRITSLVQHRLVLAFGHGSRLEQDTLYLYTSYVLGRYFCWTSILQKQIQFLKTPSGDRNIAAHDLLIQIERAFLIRREENFFQLYHGHQMAIGEIMTVEDPTGELVCMGYASFVEKYWAEPSFRTWFLPIVYSLEELTRMDADVAQPRYARLVAVNELLLRLLPELNSKWVLRRSPWHRRDPQRAASSV